jgi:lipopolysaccharide transport system permease protein
MSTIIDGTLSQQEQGKRESERLAPLIIEPSRTISLQLDRLWRYRELLYFLVWRDLKVRYKQTALGIFWIVLQPLLTTFIFTVLFGLLLQVPSGDAPYPVFALAALIPWHYFSGSLTRASTSLVNSANLVTKVYFPRLIIPLTGVLAGLVDFAIGFVLLIVVMAIYGIRPAPAALLLPAFLLLAMATALGVGLWLSALNVRYRDVNYLVPFLVQIWFYATPVAYGSMLIPEQYRWLLGLNPMTGVVEGFRWALLGQEPPGQLFALSVTITIVILMTGLVYFRRTERTFADIV